MSRATSPWGNYGPRGTCLVAEDLMPRAFVHAVVDSYDGPHVLRIRRPALALHSPVELRLCGPMPVFHVKRGAAADARCYSMPRVMQDTLCSSHQEAQAVPKNGHKRLANLTIWDRDSSRKVMQSLMVIRSAGGGLWFWVRACTGGVYPSPSRCRLWLVGRRLRSTCG